MKRPKRSRFVRAALAPRWKAREVKTLRTLRRKKWTAAEIAKRLGRTRNEVRGKLWRMKQRAA